ncbi:ammonium transporter [soil metagenome]
MLNRKSILSTLTVAALAVSWVGFTQSSFAQQDATAAPSPAAAADAAPAASPAPADPTLEQRVADIEAYFNNAARTPNVASKINVPGPGHNAWQMTSTALVLFMTLPGLALFYGGLVRSKNVLSILAMCMGITGLVTVLWYLCGYSLTFGGTLSWYGNLDNAMFKGMTPGGVGAGWYWISDDVFAMFQLTFAIITPALIFGATAERMKFVSILVFTAIWMFAVYFPLAHMVWSVKGLMAGLANPDAAIKAIDFAGGTVVHMSSGWSALVLCIILGPRLGFGKEPMPPHSMVLCMIGTGMLYVGWFGFNAGSALGADMIASNAFTTTMLATATAGLVWAFVEWILKGKPSVLGFCSGIVAGLVVITPACGFVTASGAMIIGIAAGIIPFITVTYMKKLIGYDDALDTFGVHGVGGTLGAIMTGLLASADANSAITPELQKTLMVSQFTAIGITIALSVVMTAIIALLIKFTIGLRPTPEAESEGLDISDHGEEGYILNK